MERKEARLAAGQNRVDASSAADARGAIFAGYEFGGFREPPCSVVEKWKISQLRDARPFC